MRVKIILHIVGGIMLATGCAMTLPLAFSLYYGDSGRMPLAQAALTCAALGFALLQAFRREFDRTTVLTAREGVATVSAGWLAACLAGSLPYVFAGIFPNFTDAAFESFSGFSATGATALVDVEIIAPGLLVWRAMTLWLGGMGVVVLSLAVLPYLGVGGMQLFRAEIPGPSPDKLTPRLKDTAKMLWKIYLLLTAAQLVLLSFSDLNFFEALAQTFSSVATGGFATRNASLGGYSVYVQWVCTLFIFLGGINFIIHFNLLRGRAGPVFRDEEFRFYLALIAVASVILFIRLLPSSDSVAYAFRTSVIQVVSIVTTTGYATADYETFDSFSQFVILLLIVIGGSAASTAGGLKGMRVVVYMKSLYHELYCIVHPNAVRSIKYNGQVLSPGIVGGCIAYGMLFCALWAVSSLALTLAGVDLATAVSAAMTCLSNVGPAFGTIGPTENYAHFTAAAKWILAADMLLGRLEFFTLLVVFFPEYWRR